MEIPYRELSPEVLKKIIEEYVLQEGTDYGDVEYSLNDKIIQVMRQLERGEASVLFDVESESCSIQGVKRKVGE